MAAGPDPAALGALIQKYTEETNKRLALRPEGTKQYVELKEASNDRIKALGDDIWADWDALNASNNLKDGDEVKVLAMGAGFSGILLAVNLIKEGFKPSDIRIVDTAGGFGGTWYWNRFPGIHCDTESYIYLPLIEEMGYVPTKKWIPGSEILAYVNQIVDKYQLKECGVFATEVVGTEWDDAAQLWTTKLSRHHGPGKESTSLTVMSQFFITGGGVLSRPHAPRIPGLETFEGSLFHTSRWDYSISGGSPTDDNLTKLAGKRVGYIGTGATAVQAVPKLAQSAGELFVIQRTPSACYERNNRPTDPEEWKSKIANREGWQKHRRENWTAWTAVGYGPPPAEENLVGDEWSKFPGYAATVGSPFPPFVQPTPDKIQEHVGALHATDMPTTEAQRARVDQIVQDKEVAEKLKPWYPTWCKRPTFSDEYLQTFNLPNVKLIDTDGRGVDSANAKGLVVNGQELPLDVLILSTGFVSPAIGNGNPAVRAGITIKGRGGLDISEKWQTQGASSLHGVAVNGYPNFFFVGPLQAGASANNMHNIVVATEHISHIISKANERTEAGKKAIIEVNKMAEEGWAMQVMAGAAFFAGVATCTPGYVTREGEFAMEMAGMSMQEQMKAARASLFPGGMNHYVRTIEQWRAEGSMQGFEVTAA